MNNCVKAKKWKFSLLILVLKFPFLEATKIVFLFDFSV